MSFCTILMKIGPIFSIKKLYFDHILNTFHIFMKLTCITLYILYCIKLLYDIVFHYAEIGYVIFTAPLVTIYSLEEQQSVYYIYLLFVKKTLG